MCLQGFLPSSIEKDARVHILVGRCIVKSQKNRFEALVWIIILACILLGICGCDLVSLFGDADKRELRPIHFDLAVYVYSSYTGTPIPGAHVYLKAQKYRYEDNSRVPGTDFFVDRQIYADGMGEWELDYKLLYDNEERRFMEYVVVNIYASHESLASRDSVAGYLKIYPAGGGWSPLNFTERRGSTMINRKILVRAPLKMPSIFD